VRVLGAANSADKAIARAYCAATGHTSWKTAAEECDHSFGEDSVSEGLNKGWGSRS